MVEIDLLLEAFSNVSDLRILVIGDFILDTYCSGFVGRISPEAPVMVFNEKDKKALLGGAANVALGIKALGAQVKFVTKVGDDSNAKIGLDLLEKEQIETCGVFVQKKYKTSHKTRLIANNQQILRIDQECVENMPEYLEDCVFDYVKQVIEVTDLITLSDYDKGFFSHSLLQRIILLAQQHGCRVIVDPKGNDFTKYKGAYLLKPNEKEAYIAANVKKDQSIDEVYNKLKKIIGIESLLITRSEKGMSYFFKNSRKDFAARKKEVVDVTGAGDTCLSVISICVALGICVQQAIELANLAACHVINKVGCFNVNLALLLSLAFKYCDKTVVKLEDLKIIQSLEMMDEFILLRVDQRIVDFKYFIDGINQIKGVGQKILVLIDKNFEDQFHLLLAIEKIDMVFKIDSCNFNTVFNSIYIYSNAKFMQNQSVLC